MSLSVRQLRPAETGAVSAVFSAMTPEQRASRFHTGMPRMTEGQLRYLAAVDGHRHVAYVALLDGAPIGIARYVLVQPSVAEVAVEVAHPHTGRGVATMLLDSLRMHAQREGVRRLVLEIQADNAPALHLARRAEARMITRAGNVQGTIELATSAGASCECATPLTA